MADNESDHMPLLAGLVSVSEDVIDFLRHQMEANAAPTKKKKEGEEESSEKVKTGARPKSKPPLGIDAMDAADSELAVLVKWADQLGLPYRGPVWRVNGVPKGVLYGSLQPVRDIARVVKRRYEEGWPAFPEAFTKEVLEVRNRNRSVWHELEKYLAIDKPKRTAPENQMSMF